MFRDHNTVLPKAQDDSRAAGQQKNKKEERREKDDDELEYRGANPLVSFMPSSWFLFDIVSQQESVRMMSE